jgi:cellulose synthase/poly-beta-1,6-N-acetylglucosamine synthase-like glycosyltransferase
MIMRPSDFCAGFTNYLMGLIMYMLLTPFFINVLTVYTMCNLHDVSWGNRPAGTQTAEELSIHAKKQKKLADEY